jgi:hypothetical protein
VLLKTSVGCGVSVPSMRWATQSSLGPRSRDDVVDAAHEPVRLGRVGLGPAVGTLHVVVSAKGLVVSSLTPGPAGAWRGASRRPPPGEGPRLARRRDRRDDGERRGVELGRFRRLRARDEDLESSRPDEDADRLRADGHAPLDRSARRRWRRGAPIARRSRRASSPSNRARARAASPRDRSAASSGIDGERRSREQDLVLDGSRREVEDAHAVGVGMHDEEARAVGTDADGARVGLVDSPARRTTELQPRGQRRRKPPEHPGPARVHGVYRRDGEGDRVGERRGEPGGGDLGDAVVLAVRRDDAGPRVAAGLSATDPDSPESTRSAICKPARAPAACRPSGAEEMGALSGPLDDFVLIAIVPTVQDELVQPRDAVLDELAIAAFPGRAR